MKKPLIAIGLVALLVVLYLVLYKPQDKAYIRRTEQKLAALANDTATTSRRIKEIKKKDGWSDGGVGIAADGYIFYYDIHESHGMDSISDIHLLYLPDEKRFQLSHGHFCCDLSKFAQAKNKAEVVKLFSRLRFP